MTHLVEKEIVCKIRNKAANMLFLSVSMYLKQVEHYP